MNATSQRCIWSAADLRGWDIPAETKVFLMTTGLPHRLGESTIEFGIFDECHVIGCDYECPVFVTPDGSVWRQPDEGEPAFMNSSVMLLSRFIEISEAFDVVCHEDSSLDIGLEIDRWQRMLTDTDPTAMTRSGAIWPQIVDSARATLS